MDILSLLEKDRLKWVKIVINLGCPPSYAEDVVQDMYLKIASLDNNKRIMFEDSGEVNYWYIILTLRSVCYDFLKSQNKFVDYNLVETESDSIDINKEEAFDRLYNNIIQATNKFGRYGSKLTQAYFKTDLSLRQIASQSNISLSSIFHSIKMYRAMLVEEFGEDFEDYKNGDYNHIK